MSDQIQSCIIDPFPWYQPGGLPSWPVQPSWPQPTYQPLRFTPTEPRLSDEDVERIAKRVAELLRESP